MKTQNLDIAEIILNLSLVIKYLVEQNNLNKKVILEDFEDLIMQITENNETN